MNIFHGLIGPDGDDELLEPSVVVGARHGLREIARLATNVLAGPSSGLAERATDIACAHQILAEIEEHLRHRSERTATETSWRASVHQLAARARRHLDRDQHSDRDRSDGQPAGMDPSQ